MRRLIFAAMLVVGPAHSQSVVTLYGPGNLDCGTFLEARSNNASLYQFTSFVYGYISAYNFFSVHPQVTRELPTATIAAYLDKFCRDNPLKTVQQGTTALIGDVGGWKIGTPVLPLK